MKIEHIVDNTQYIEMVSTWIYKEFIEGINKYFSYTDIINAYSTRKKDVIPMTLIAIEGDECIGTVTLFANDLKTRMDLTPWLGALYVDGKHRGKGIARKLMDALIIETKKLGNDLIYLRTEHAPDYYRKLGWKYLFKTIDEFGNETEVFSKNI